MPRVRSPKRGSRAFSPRKRAKNINGRVRFWPEARGDPHLLGFAGYKAGMTHAFVIEDRPNSPDFGMEMKNAATIIDVPPMTIVGIRGYEKTYDGLKAIAEAWMDDLPINVLKTIKTIRGIKPDSGLKILDRFVDRIHQLRVIAATQPHKAGVSKKNADILEIAIGGGSIPDQLEYAKGLFGERKGISDIFKLGETIDIIGVTKGKGFQGPVKRWGVRILQRKSRKTKRGVASIGPWKPRRVMPGVPRAGQMGLHNRMERNKRILLMGSDFKRVTPAGGFKSYGNLQGDYVLLKGSVMGPAKRLITLRKASRRLKNPLDPIKVTYLNTEFRNGEN
ncbi:50S ribosomal protein L3 [Candidatus Bathyarchaeota archaeon]|nr:50S ribosomal protein L3 [Candidatus Bathyarchaeota archaeon]MDP6049166.1 50S ribosomal protein L3 [Candidatus Bathyarchaeota archaeon]MDP7207625.1 50S ribosomal protein L3 [Candidatus Bathyarchaeota archaeon]MDP7443670.1 50S ribosomal protein L3 [Candidatus Bathyarchaeota archaeon]